MLKVASQRSGIAFFLAAVAGTASAAETPMLDDFAINIGLFANNANAQVSVGSGSGNGSAIDVKNDLGIDGTQSLPYISLS